MTRASPDNGNRRRIRASRLNDGESIMLDGRLDEPAWTRAEPAGDFVQIDPDNGQPATERTEVRILFTPTRCTSGSPATPTPTAGLRINVDGTKDCPPTTRSR